MKYSYDELAKMIDHSLLHPTMTDKDLEEGCHVAAKYKVASVCIKPYYVKRAVELLQGTGVLVGAVVGFPHGSSTTEAKRYETEIACRDGAVEIDMVINIGKALSGEDRKSTRLNSSHSQISYAVFCLKKKRRQSPDSNRLIVHHNG